MEELNLLLSELLNDFKNNRIDIDAAIIKFDTLIKKFEETREIKPSENIKDLINTLKVLLRKKINVLIIEDHPIVKDLIVKALKKIEVSQNKYHFAKIDSVTNLKDAYNKLSFTTLQNVEKYDLIMLDIQLPAYEEKRLFSGEDIGDWISKTFDPKPMIIVITTYSEGYRIDNILKTVKPNGFIIKADIDSTTFVEAIHKAIETPPFFANTVVKKISQKIMSGIELDKLDRKILFYISIGANVTELSEIMHKSKSTIEKRKRRLMEMFGIKNASTMQLIAVAKANNFI